MSRNRFAVVAVCAVSLAVASVFTGCSGVQKGAPHFGMGTLDVQTQLSRKDIVIMDRVEGSSTTTSYLLGLVQIIDNDKNKMRVVGITLFTDKHTPYFNADNAGFGSIFARAFSITTPEDRAYYKALEAAPDADAILPKSMDKEETGIPVLFCTTTATFKGKAVKFIADK